MPLYAVTSRYHVVVAMASESIDNAKSVALQNLWVLTLKTKSNARRSEVVFDASMSGLAIYHQVSEDRQKKAPSYRRPAK
jgi:hypothetical protein